jgi:hypothetical protein
MHWITSAEYPVEQIVSDIIQFAVCSSITQAQGDKNSCHNGLELIQVRDCSRTIAAAINVVDFYLDHRRTMELVGFQQLIGSEDAGSYERLRGYVRESMRQYPLIMASVEVTEIVLGLIPQVTFFF